MHRHSTLLVFSTLTLAACGGGAPWTPVPASNLPIDPRVAVVRGAVELISSGEKKGRPAGLWHAFRAAGAGLSLKAAGDEARVVLLVATSGEPLRAAVEKLAAKAKEVAWKGRPAPITVIDLG